MRTAIRNKTLMGTARASMLTGSPLGVITAATAKMAMIETRHCLSNVCGVMTPTICKKTNRTGSKNPIPKAKTMSATRLMYFDIW